MASGEPGRAGSPSAQGDGGGFGENGEPQLIEHGSGANAPGDNNNGGAQNQGGPAQPTGINLQAGFNFGIPQTGINPAPNAGTPSNPFGAGAGINVGRGRPFGGKAAPAQSPQPPPGNTFNIGDSFESPSSERRATRRRRSRESFTERQYGDRGGDEGGSVDKEMREMFERFRGMMRGDRGGVRGKGDSKEGVLGERHFRRMDRFSGEMGKFRNWVFDLTVAIGEVDLELSNDIRELVKKGNGDLKAEGWDPLGDDRLTKRVGFEGRYRMYKGPLYAVLCSLTDGEAKNILRCMDDNGMGYDGFKGIMALGKRFDVRTKASMLQAYLDVVAPKGSTKIGDIVPRINAWEAKILGIVSRYGTECAIPDGVKMAIFVGMLPQDFRDMILQNTSLTSGTLAGSNYLGIRDYD